jgi:nicotinate-nucleotide pyrophosphorylase (carboxylating)
VTSVGYEDAVRRAARLALSEDLAGYGDVTGACFGGRGLALVVAREDGVLSGRAPFLAAAELVDLSLRVVFARNDGESFTAGTVVASVEGPIAAVLALERTGLNFLGRLSGVATATARYVAQTVGTKARIAATRKTTPGLRALEKEAVVHGGGTPHRFGLFDGVLIKDNHIAAAGGLRAAIELVREHAPHTHGVEVEVETLEQLDEALTLAVGAVLLDNMSAELVREAVRRVAGRALVEVSGGVRLDRVRELAATGVDIISVGALTTRADWIDIGLDMEQ